MSADVVQSDPILHLSLWSFQLFKTTKDFKIIIDEFRSK